MDDVVAAHQEWKGKTKMTLGSVRVFGHKLAPGELDLLPLCLEGWTMTGPVDQV